MKKTMFWTLFSLLMGCVSNGIMGENGAADIQFIEDSTNYTLDSTGFFQPVDSYKVYESENIRLYYVYPESPWYGFSYVYAYNKLGERDFQVSSTHDMSTGFFERQKSLIDSLYGLKYIDSIDHSSLLIQVICAWKINATYLSSFGYYRQMQKPLLRLNNLLVATDPVSKEKMLDRVEYTGFWRAQPNVEMTMFHSIGSHKSAVGKLYHTLELTNGDGLKSLEREYERRRKILIENIKPIETTSGKVIVVMMPEMQLFTIDLEEFTCKSLISYENDSLQTNVLRLKLGYYR